MTKRSRTYAQKVFNILSIFLAFSLIIPVHALPALSVSYAYGQEEESIQEQNQTEESQTLTIQSGGSVKPDACPFNEEDGEIIYFDTKAKPIRSDKADESTLASLSFDVIPQGTYKISLAGYGKNHPGAGPQPNEKWQLRLKNSEGVVFATTSPTQDLLDEEKSRIDVVETSFIISEDIYSAEAHHSEFLDESSTNSINPVCALLEKEKDDNNGNNGPVCGNGILEAGEMCDDGNTVNGDGCSSSCKFEILSCENTTGDGWYAEYFNYSKDHKDMQLNKIMWPDDGHGDPLGAEDEWTADWYSDEYLKFSRVDSNLKFGEDFFPFDIAQVETHKGGSDNGQHEFHFGVHWRALVTGDGVYDYRLKSDDDAWVYIDGELLVSLPGIHAPETVQSTTTLNGAHVVDIYFAERHTVRSHFSFEFIQGQNPITIKPLPSKCQPSITVCKYIDKTGDGASVDDEKYGAGWKFALVDTETQTLPLAEEVYKKTDGSSCVSYNNLLPGAYRSIEEQLPAWPLTASQIIKNNNNPEDIGPDPYSFVDVEVGLGDDITINYYNYNVQYCGDGVVNQEWESCDGGDQCTDQCQFVDDTMCRDLVLAQINVDNIINEGAGSTTSDVYLGSKLNKIPEGTWFALFYSGLFMADPDISSYEDVDGLSVERQEGKLRIVQHGSKGKKDIEHTQGTVVFSNALITDVVSDDSNGFGKSNRLEQGFNGTGVGDVNPGDDEVATSSINTVDFYLTTNVADDGFITSWKIVEDCIGICGFKFNDKNENGIYDEDEAGLPGWEFQLQEKLQCEAGGDWASKVISFTQGSQSDGTPVAQERSNENKALGLAQGDDTLNFVSLGIGGEIILYFENLIENGPGPDIEVVETSFNNPSCGDYPEYIEVFASQTGLPDSWVSLGDGCLDSKFDLGSLPWAQYVKLVDKTNPELFKGAVVDGYDIDGVRALHCQGLSQVLATETSNKNGEFCFVEGIEPGNYHISEVMQSGWKNTTPIAQQVKFDGKETVNILFGNAELPFIPGEISGLKYYDINGNGSRDENEPGLEGWEIQLFQYPNAPWKDAPENTPLATTFTDNNGAFWFTDLTPGVYQVFEVQQDGWMQTEPGLTDDGMAHSEFEGGNVLPLSLFPLETTIDGNNIDPNTNEGKFLLAKIKRNPTILQIIGNAFDCVFTHWNDMSQCTSSEDLLALKYYTVYLEEGAVIDTAVFGNTEEPLAQCEDGIDNDGDGLIDIDDPDCHTDGDPDNEDSYDPDRDEINDNSGGGTGLVILNETTGTTTATTATLTWNTNIPATTRVIFGTTGTSTVGDAPNYGYSSSTILNVATTTSHSMELTGLLPETTYFWRAVSYEENSPTNEILGIELSFTTSALPMCSDGIDNDGDGLIDIDDPDCHTDGDPDNEDSYDPDRDENTVNLIITNEQVSGIGETGATLTWNTNIPATTRVIFGTTGTSTVGDAPNYGYSSSTIEGTILVMPHSVVLTGLTKDTTYFWRAVAKDATTTASEIVGNEKSFKTNKEVENTGGGQGGTETGSTGGGGGGGTITGSDPFSYGVGGGTGNVAPPTIPPQTGGGQTVTPPFGQGGGEILVQAPTTPQTGSGSGSGEQISDTETETGATSSEGILDQFAGLSFLGLTYDCPWWVSLLALIVLIITTFYIYKKRESTLQALIVFILGFIVLLLLGAYNCLWLLALLAALVIILIGVLLRDTKKIEKTK